MTPDSPVDAPPKPKIAAVVFNPTKVNEEKLRASVATTQASEGWGETVWFETSEADPGELVARQAVALGVDVVLAVGGDGTVRAVATALRATGIALALVPSGTGNLLARNLGLALDDLPGSVRTAFTGDVRPIDVGALEIRRESGARESFIFLVMAGIGLDAQMIANTDPELKRRVGWVAYVDAIRKSLRDTDQLTVRYNLDRQGNRSAQVHTVLIGNCGSLPGNIVLLPDAEVDDGLFDIVALRPEGLSGWVQIWAKIVWENGILRRSQVGRKLISLSREVRTLRYLKGRELTLRLEKPEEFELDGDSFGKLVALRAVVDPLALIIRVPATAVID
ncbi:MAG: NAD(+)/NADH kinase [Microbacteriaceae bacterium]|nr:NAD(+)/NADH kinase [Microbacteriaceae bacterium]